MNNKLKKKTKNRGGRPRLDPEKKVKYRTIAILEEDYLKLQARAKCIRVPLARSFAAAIRWLLSEEQQASDQQLIPMAQAKLPETIVVDRRVPVALTGGVNIPVPKDYPWAGVVGDAPANDDLFPME